MEDGCGRRKFAARGGKLTISDYLASQPAADTHRHDTIDFTNDLGDSEEPEFAVGPDTNAADVDEPDVEPEPATCDSVHAQVVTAFDQVVVGEIEPLIARHFKQFAEAITDPDYDPAVTKCYEYVDQAVRSLARQAQTGVGLSSYCRPYIIHNRHTLALYATIMP